MDFRGMKRKDLQTLCKKHGIPANLKNTEMASRLASVFEKETKEIVSQMKLSPEDSVEADSIKENQCVSRKDKKVTFSPESENEVFEFTRSVKKLQRKNVQQGGVRLRRSKQSVAKGITVSGSHKNESNKRRGIAEAEKECSLSDATKAQKVPRRSKRIGSSGSTQEVAELIALEQFEDKDISKGLYRNIQDGFQFEKVGRQSMRLAAKIAKSSVECGTSKAGTLLDAKRSKRLADTDTKEDELVKNNATEVSVDYEVQETGKRHRKNVQDDSEVEKVPRRSRRFVNDIDLQTNTQDQRKSIRLKASNANPSMGGGTLDGTESKEERTTKLVKKGSAAVNSREGEPLIDCEVQTTEICRGMKVQDVSKVEMVTRRSKRLWNNVNVPMDKRPLVDGNVRTVKCNDLEVEKAPKQSRQLEKSVSELLVDGQVQKGDKKPKITSGTDHESTKLLRRSKRTADNMLGQAMSNSPNRCLVIDSARDGASIDNMNDEMQVRVRYTRNYSKSDSVKAAIVVEGNLVEKKTNEALDSLVKSSKRVTRKMSGIDIETASTQSNLMQEESGGVYVEARGSSKKPKIMNQECIKDTPQVMIENSPSSFETKAAESATENVLDFTLEKLVHSPQRTSTQELNCELMEEEREEKQEQDRVPMAATNKDKEEASSLSELMIERSEVSNPESELFLETNPPPESELFLETNSPPSSVQLAGNPESGLGVHTGHILVKDIVSTVIAKEDSKTQEEILISIPRYVLKEHSFVAKAVLENSAECWNEIHSSKDGEKGSLEKEIQSENRHGNFSEYNTENSFVAKVLENSAECWNKIHSSKDGEKGSLEKEIQSENRHGNFSEYNTENSTAEEQADICKVSRISVGHCVNRETLDEVKDDSLNKSKRTISSERGCKLNALELSGSLSTDFGSLSAKEENVSECLEEDEMKALSQPIPIFLENSAECWNEIYLSKDGEKGSLEKEIQSENQHGNFSEYNTENSSAAEQADICKVGRISVGHCVNLETLDEVKDDSLNKSERTISSERDCKVNALELSGSLSTDFASLSAKEENVSECLEEDEMKALSQPIPIDKAASNALDESAVFTTPERNLMLMEQLSENGKIRAADTVTHHNDEAVESHAVVFTTHEQVSLLGDSGLDEVGKEEEHTTTDLPDEYDVPNTTERYLMLGGSRQNEPRNEGESIVVKLHDESNIATSPRQSSVEDFKGDGIERNEENRNVELHCESGTCTTPDRHALLLENSGGNKAMELYEESVVFTGLEERHELFGYSGQDKITESEVKKDAQFYEEVGLSTGIHKDLPLADPELGEAGWIGINNAGKSGLRTSPERQLLYGDSELKNAVKTAKKAAVEFHDESAARNIPERHSFPEEAELEEAAKSEENKAVELQVDCDIFNGAEKQFLLETDEGMKGDNITAKSHDMSDVLTASESHSLMGDFEPAESENKYEESKDVELLAESNISTNLERHLLFGDFGLDRTRKIKDNTSATCKESFVFTSPERNQLIENAEPHTAGKQERKEVEFKDESAFFTRLESRLLLGESGQDRFGNSKSGSSQYQSHHASSLKVIMKDDGVVQESHVADQDFRENTTADSSGSISSKVSYSHELNSGEETAGAKFIPNGSQATNIVGLEAIQGTSKQSRHNSPHVDSVNLFDFDIEGADTIMDAERNVYIIALPAKSNCETTGKISSQLEVAETCSMVSEESSPSTNIQHQMNDSSEELAITGNNEADELIEAKATKNLDSSGGSSVSEKTCVLGETEHENLSYISELEFKTTYEESGHKFLKDEATGPIGTAIEKDISLTHDEFIVQNNRNEEAAGEEMIKRETTPSPEETLNDSSENRKEYLNIGESGTLSEKQARREPMLIYRTQVKPKRQDMKENAPNSKIVDNLNVTAPRTAKRQPLQDLRKN